MLTHIAQAWYSTFRRLVHRAIMCTNRPRPCRQEVPTMGILKLNLLADDLACSKKAGELLQKLYMDTRSLAFSLHAKSSASQSLLRTRGSRDTLLQRRLCSSGSGMGGWYRWLAHHWVTVSLALGRLAIKQLGLCVVKASEYVIRYDLAAQRTCYSSWVFGS